MTRYDDVSEFEWLSPDRVDAVGTPANGTAWLMLKAASDPAVKRRLRAKDRHALSDDDFAYIDSEGERHLPINDEAHVRNALARFNQTHFESAEAKAKAHRKIVARAKEMGIEVSDDASKEVGHAESESQTGQVHAGEGTSADVAPDDGGTPPHCDAQDERPQVDGGQGDTAPDKDVPRSEADSQTGEVEDRPDDGGNADQLRRQHAQTQKAKKKGKGKPVSVTNPDSDNDADDSDDDSDDDESASKEAPGSPAWQHKDVALAEEAVATLQRGLELVRQFEAREKTETTSKAASNHPSRAISALGITPAIKELESMTQDELLKLLDEREQARKAAKKARKEKEAKKAAKREAAKAANTDEAQQDPTADLSKTLETLTESLTAVKAQVEAIASQDTKPRPLANATGIPRGENAGSAFKQLEDRIANARTEQERRDAHRQLTMAKAVANESTGRAPVSTVSGMGYPIVHNRYQLGDDQSVRGY